MAQETARTTNNGRIRRRERKHVKSRERET
jgi:hypothetical protein